MYSFICAFVVLYVCTSSVGTQVTYIQENFLEITHLFVVKTGLFTYILFVISKETEGPMVASAGSCGRRARWHACVHNDLISFKIGHQITVMTFSLLFRECGVACTQFKCHILRFSDAFIASCEENCTQYLFKFV